jgi:hypothetical protein
VNSADFTGPVRSAARGVAHRLDVLRHAELGGVAQAHDQHARRLDAGQVMQREGLIRSCR